MGRDVIRKRWGHGCSWVGLFLGTLCFRFSVYDAFLLSAPSRTLCSPPAPPSWVKQRSHLTSTSTRVLMTHGCDFINCYNSGRKSHVEPSRNHSRFYANSRKASSEPTLYEISITIKIEQRPESEPQGGGLDKSHFHHTPSHTHPTLTPRNRDSRIQHVITTLQMRCFSISDRNQAHRGCPGQLPMRCTKPQPMVMVPWPPCLRAVMAAVRIPHTSPSQVPVPSGLLSSGHSSLLLTRMTCVPVYPGQPPFIQWLGAPLFASFQFGH